LFKARRFFPYDRFALMNRSGFAIALLSTFLAACAPRADVIQSGVSGTLTALAPTPVLETNRPTSTPVPTVLPPTITPVSSDTPIPSPAIGPSLTPTPFTAGLGELIFEDTFNAPGGWALGDSVDTNVAINSNILFYTQKTPQTFSFRVIGKVGADFYAEVNTALASDCRSGDRFGLMFRVQDANNYYAYQIDCDGRYRLTRYASGAANPIVDWTQSDLIKRGAKANNKLGVIAKGPSLTVLVNDAQLAAAEDSAFANGRFGLWMGTNVTANFTVAFDDLRAYNLP
jgi:hypothetical protein